MTDSPKPKLPAKPKSKRSTEMENVDARRQALAHRRTKLSVEEVIERGAVALAKAAPDIAAKLIAAALDETHPLHEKALLMLGERIWSVRGFAASAIQMTGAGQNGVAAAPSVQINVVTSSGPVRPDAAIKVKPVEAPALRHIPDESEERDE